MTWAFFTPGGYALGRFTIGDLAPGGLALGGLVPSLLKNVIRWSQVEVRYVRHSRNFVRLHACWCLLLVISFIPSFFFGMGSEDDIVDFFLETFVHFFANDIGYLPSFLNRSFMNERRF